MTTPVSEVAELDEVPGVPGGCTLPDGRVSDVRVPDVRVPDGRVSKVSGSCVWLMEILHHEALTQFFEVTLFCGVCRFLVRVV